MVRLNYELGKQPNSAEADHITAHARGGRDELSNTRVVCRRCNQARGSKPLRPSRDLPAPSTTTTLITW